jgi:hypothetical protein
MTTTLTLEQVVADLRQIAHDQPDHVCPYLGSETDRTMTCAYFAEGQPSCIVGHILARHGITQDDLGPLNHGADVSDLVMNEIIDIDLWTEDLLLVAQQEQDAGSPWGRAVQEALNRLDEEHGVTVEAAQS